MKKIQKWVAMFLLGIGVVWNTAHAGAKPDDVALALLTPAQVAGVKGLAKAAPSVLEFNGRLDTTRRDAYDFYVARLWLNPANGSDWITNAITVYDSKKSAEAGLQAMAGKGTKIEGLPVGDQSVVVWQAAAKKEPAGLNYRFLVGRFAARVGFNFPAKTTPQQAKRWLPQLHELAVAQALRLQQLEEGKLKTSFPKELAKLLPKKLPATSLLGTALFTAPERRATEHNFKSHGKIAGFQNGILRRFLLNDRPEEVVEVAVLEFDSGHSAAVFKAELQHSKGPQIQIASDLTGHSLAKDFGDLVELQSVQDRYVIDVTVMAPFGTLNKGLAKNELSTFTQKTLVGFRNRK